MTLIHARIIAEYPGAFSSRDILDAYLLLRGARTQRPAPVIIRGDPDAKEDPGQSDAALVEALDFELAARHNWGSDKRPSWGVGE